MIAHLKAKIKSSNWIQSSSKFIQRMFQDLATDESVRVVIQNFVVKWYDSAEREIVQLMHAIKFYHSKGELRMVDLNHAILKEEFEIALYFCSSVMKSISQLQFSRQILKIN